MVFSDTLFILSFILILAIIFIELFNLLSSGDLFDVRWVFILFIGFIMLYLISMSLLTLNYTNTTYALMFRIESFLSFLNLIAFIIGLMFYAKRKIEEPVEAYQPKPLKY